jgi:hypothetical protein
MTPFFPVEFTSIGAKLTGCYEAAYSPQRMKSTMGSFDGIVDQRQDFDFSFRKKREENVDVA